MKDNKLKTDKNTNDAACSIKNGYIHFDVIFKTLVPGGELTPERIVETLFGKAYLIVDSIFAAIHTLTKGIENLDAKDNDTLLIIQSCASLSSIGQVFAEEIANQFSELQILEGGQDDE